MTAKPRKTTEKKAPAAGKKAAAKPKAAPKSKPAPAAPPPAEDAAVKAVLDRYRREVASRYRAVRPDEVGAVGGWPAWVTPKLDGELWFAAKHGGAVSLRAANGRVLEDGALLEELRAGFGARAAEGEVVAGELYAESARGRPRVGDVARALADSGERDALQFAAFDVAAGAGLGAAPSAWAERSARLEALFAGGKRVRRVEGFEAAGPDAVRAAFSEQVATGKAEGLVVRLVDGRVLKLKPEHTLDAAVVGYSERGADQVASVLLGLLRGDGTFQLLGGVGNLGSEGQRRQLKASLAGTEVESALRMAGSSGELYRFVRPTVVVELSCTDLQAETSDGEPVQQWALRLGEAGFRQVAQVAGASLLHPVLSRVRTDKSVTRPDVRVEQLAERVEVRGFSEAPAPVELPLSTRLRREVYTKALKGQLGVKKLVTWKTNKEAFGWPAYVVHWTDYSGGRATPLEREVRPAANESAANALADALLAEEIGKGWERVE
ncbi:MAG: hypothetical protein RL653_1015 [Pseudomonadota bacterium]|jgi:hypothetical protein